MSIQPPAAQPRGAWNGFTLIELLVVISVIGILASLIVGVSGVATSKARVSQVQALLNKVGTAIDTYHADFGSYPPDARFSNGLSNTATNQLFYELTGSVAQADGTYLPQGGGQPIRGQELRRHFGVKGLQNVAMNQAESKGYLTLSDSQIGLLSVDPDKAADGSHSMAAEGFSQRCGLPERFGPEHFHGFAAADSKCRSQSQASEPLALSIQWFGPVQSTIIRSLAGFTGWNESLPYQQLESAAQSL